MRAVGNKLVFELGSGVAGFRVVLWSKIGELTILTERVLPVGRLVGCKYLRGRGKKNTHYWQSMSGQGFEYLAYRRHPGCG
jgi:hypothetical protein